MQAATLHHRTRSRSTIPRAIPLRLARFWLICLFFFIWTCIILGRLFLLQVLHYQEYVGRAKNQQERTFEVAPRRGVIYDRNLHELAMTVQVDSVYAVPTEIEDKAATAHILAAIVHSDPEDSQTTEEQIEERLEAGRGFAWVARRVSSEVAAKIRALNMKGVYFQKEFQRFYPDNEIAAQVLGYVGVDDTGLGGLEEKFEPQLHGVPGRMLTAMDARRHILGSSERDPEPGRNFVLTIDSNIQFMAERALDHTMQRTQAASGTLVVQDVHTGQILALAIRPTFNPNQFRRTTPALLRDHAVSDVYEPGSTFKLVTYSAAMDQKVASPDDPIDCQGGKITLAGRVIHDNQGEHMGVVPIHKALEESSDVAAVKLALKVGPDRFYDYIRAFGFGSRPGVELPGETRGLLRPVKKWSGSSIGSIAIGQEVAVTPLQLVSMVSTIANGGVYLQPHVLMPAESDAGNTQLAGGLAAHPFHPGEDLPDPLPSGAHRVISTFAAAEMRKMMEGVVLYGTGRLAQLNGYSAGGKTGTAQKVDPVTHLYSKTMHIASFAGIAPVNNPVISVAIVIDTPRVGSYYGAAVSAPAFAEAAQQVLEYLGVPHDEQIRTSKPTPVPLNEAREDDDDSGADINALYSAVNDLPTDDPLRSAPARFSDPRPDQSQDPGAKPSPGTVQGKPAAGPSQPVETSASTTLAAASSPPAPARPQHPPATVVINTGPQVKVPSLVGLSMRQVIEAAAASGLEVELAGSGTVREQAPAAGTLVDPGTKIVVRGTR